MLLRNKKSDQHLRMQPAVRLCLFSSHESHLRPRTPNLQLHTPYSSQLSFREPWGLQLQAWKVKVSEAQLGN